MDNDDFVYATGADIKKVIDAIEPAVEDFETSHVLMACLSLAYIILRENATMPDTVEAVKLTSDFMVDLIKDQEKKINFNLETIDIPPSQLH